MELSETLIKAMNPREVFSFHLLGVSIPVTDTIIVMWIIMAVLVILSIVFTAGLKTVPEGRQNFAEAIVEFINSFSENTIRHHGRHFAPYIGTLLIFLTVSNIVSIFSIFPSGEWLYEHTNIEAFKLIPEIKPPTRDVNVTACLAVISILVVLYAGIRFKKPVGWLKSFIQPVPIILPFKILDYFVRPLSLCFRLFGNILGSFIIMDMLYIAMPVLIPAPLSIYFDLFDGILQAYIFVFLTSLYIAEAIE